MSNTTKDTRYRVKISTVFHLAKFGMQQFLLNAFFRKEDKSAAVTPGERHHCDEHRGGPAGEILQALFTRSWSAPLLSCSVAGASNVHNTTQHSGPNSNIFFIWQWRGSPNTACKFPSAKSFKEVEVPCSNDVRCSRHFFRREFLS